MRFKLLFVDWQHINFSETQLLISFSALDFTLNIAHLKTTMHRQCLSLNVSKNVSPSGCVNPSGWVSHMGSPSPFVSVSSILWFDVKRHQVLQHHIRPSLLLTSATPTTIHFSFEIQRFSGGSTTGERWIAPQRPKTIQDDAYLFNYRVINKRNGA